MQHYYQTNIKKLREGLGTIVSLSPRPTSCITGSDSDAIYPILWKVSLGAITRLTSPLLTTGQKVSKTKTDIHFQCP